MKRLAISVLIVAIAIFAVIGAVSAQPKFEFKLGFKALADQVHDIVGEPLENEQWGVNGDSLQMTTKGLMVWRKADNWTAFTNGSRTWINGPTGIQDRENDERFEWEGERLSVQNTWTSLAKMPVARGGAGVVVGDNNKIYVFGGSIRVPDTHGNPTVQNVPWVDEFDPISNTWRSRTPMPDARYGFGSAAIGGKAYLVGGTVRLPDGFYAPTAEVLEYDINRDTWRSVAPLPSPRTYSAAVALQGKLYVLGGHYFGQGDSQAFSDLLQYDPGTNRWQFLSNMPSAEGYMRAAATETKIYYMRLGEASIRYVHEYDPALDKWSTPFSQRDPRRIFGMSLVYPGNGKLYGIAGRNAGPPANAKNENNVEEFDIAANVWTPKASLPTWRVPSVAAVQGRIYAIGGSLVGNPGPVFAEVEVYQP